MFSLSHIAQDKKYCQATVADGSVGLIPVSAILERPGVMLQPMPWFHGPITRCGNLNFTLYINFTVIYTCIYMYSLEAVYVCLYACRCV